MLIKNRIFNVFIWFALAATTASKAGLIVRMTFSWGISLEISLKVERMAWSENVSLFCLWKYLSLLLPLLQQSCTLRLGISTSLTDLHTVEEWLWCFLKKVFVFTMPLPNLSQTRVMWGLIYVFKKSAAFTLLPWDSYGRKGAKHPRNYCWQNTVPILSSVTPVWYVVKAAINVSVNEILICKVCSAQKKRTVVMLEKQNVWKTSAWLRWQGSNYC